jgi:branched-chain amino acid transport system ATP-binding protein
MTAPSKAPLQTQSLVKRYGGLLATDNVSLSLVHGELHAIIGPNGAGKTTLIGQLGGELQPDSGDVFLQGECVTALPAADRALRGLARSYQISSAFPEFTVIESVALAKQAHGGQSFGAWRALLKRTHLVDAAEHAIAKAGLSHRISQRVSELAHGERRQLELAMVLVSQPKHL